MAKRPTVLSTANFINRAPEWKDLYAADASCSREADMKRLMVAPVAAMLGTCQGKTVKHHVGANLFMTSSRPFDLFDPHRKGPIKLYVKRVFITDDTDVLPRYLRFVRGLVRPYHTHDEIELLRL